MIDAHKNIPFSGLHLECSAFLNKLSLENFRNFEDKKLTFDNNQILILGRNGSGKTSILEAISLLCQGRGLRGSKFIEQIKEDASQAIVNYDITSFKGSIILEMLLNKNSSKRKIYFNEKSITSGELSNLASTIWLTPQQNRLFSESQQIRRKFFDRIVYNFSIEHAKLINKFEYYQRQRLNIITHPNYDEIWAEIIEEKLSKLAVQVCEARYMVLNKLNEIITSLNTDFPKLECFLDSEIDTIYKNILDEEDLKNIFKDKYKFYRKQDTDSHKTHFGVLKSDFSAIHLGKNIKANLCSTGEQQSCIVTLLIAQTKLYIQRFEKKPILLLDELFVHLDQQNKYLLSNYLFYLNVQTFVTSTELNLCEDFAKNGAQIINL